MKKIMLALLLPILAATACTEVNELPATIETRGVEVELLGLNDCDGLDIFASSTFGFELRVDNLDEGILIEKITIDKKGGDETITSFGINNNRIYFNSCYFFDNLDEIDGTIIATGTNRINEKISSERISFTIERPLGAN